ncbi:hypothetical protein Mterra_01745 [Calidithermus terrae]|uniref:ScoMcrA-like SRA domain-containing protein n=1 Tax=Calidithermus terrae TaxID=1408545 RepID=A0A399EMR3_9DEIN|nr:hypothetical protein [Calidithermus terrae]RIH85258.1 hypothetical protein Mterra_01745 [Calidithermus terrae]
MKNPPSSPLLSWREVLARHKSLRGIAKNSLLADEGESGYRNVFLPDGRIVYVGEGLEGHQQPTGGNAVLLEALQTRRPLRVFLREGVNRWRDLGPYRVEGVEYRREAAEGRYVYWFTLAPVESGGKFSTG